MFRESNTMERERLLVSVIKRLLACRNNKETEVRIEGLTMMKRIIKKRTTG